MPSPTETARGAQQHSELLRLEFELFKEYIDQLELKGLRERLAILEDRVAELKRLKEESEKRHWQFVYIFAGGVASMLVAVIVQLVIAWVRK
jgi:uncharacterized protein YceH (UPF0502 family)